MKMIITADWHLREDRPRCRKDEDWIKTQKKALEQVADICIKKNSDLFLVGDVFHKFSEFRMVVYIQKLAQKLKKDSLSLYYLCGNHDNLYHSSLNIDKSAIGLLKNSENCFYIKDYFEKLDCDDSNYSSSNFDEEDNYNAQIVFKHTLTIPEEDKNPLIECETPESLVKKFPDAKYIFTGDYHKNFCKKIKNTYVINPGCLLRQASDMKDYQCGVYFVDTDKDIQEFIHITDNEELVDDSYILKENERDDRISNFVDKLKDTKNISLDFVSNVEESIRRNNLDENIVSVINELMEV